MLPFRPDSQSAGQKYNSNIGPNPRHRCYYKANEQPPVHLNGASEVAPGMHHPDASVYNAMKSFASHNLKQYFLGLGPTKDQQQSGQQSIRHVDHHPLSAGRAHLLTEYSSNSAV